MESNENDVMPQHDSSLLDLCMELARKMDPNQLERYYSDSSCAKRTKVDGQSPLNMLLKITVSPSMSRLMKYPIVSIDNQYGEGTLSFEPHSLLEMDIQVQRAFQTFGRDFPTAIWTCYRKRCFAVRAILPEHGAVFNTVLKIYRGAECIHERIEGLDALIKTRKRGVGGSSITHVSESRKERTTERGTDRQKLQKELKSYVMRVLPYLRSQIVAPDGTRPPDKPFCIQAISQILGVHRNTLYKPVGGEPCVIDSAGVRQRKFRRIGSRKGFKAIGELSSFECGCEAPCFAGVRSNVLQRLWNAFKVIAADLSPEEKEHRFLMNQMFCPLTNTSVRICNAAIAELYTVSEALVASARLLVHQMCEDPSIEKLPVREHGLKRYRERNHPLNRLPTEVIESVERHLDMILRPDPAAADGTNVCRVYSPEINTQEKLRRLIAADIQQESEEVVISPTSLQRMIQSYLSSRGCRISFSQADHNACPMCKTYHHEILRLHYEEKQLKQKLSPYEQRSRPMIQEDQLQFDEFAVPLEQELEIKSFRSREAISELKHHNDRDACIRRWLKQLTDHFRQVENEQRQETIATGMMGPFGWCQRRGFALVTHQDDMTKVDLPHVVVDASADITRWRFDINAHVSAVTGDCVVMSHEQGSGPKNASAIIEEILTDHILTCRGENIKVVVSDNASVGKNWLTTVVFPQYLVDQGLAEIVIVVFLENNHGKWLADMMFGQFQIRKRNSTILGIDGLLQDFKGINRPSGGRIRGYAVNPLGSVDFAAVFQSLGYETKPPKELGFKQRNIHFACACTPEARENLSPKLQILFANALPEESGMVRVCTEPPDVRPLEWRQFEDRWIDIPAARPIPSDKASMVRGVQTSEAVDAPLVIPLDKTFSASGPGVVSKRTAEHVGFNGLTFRDKMSFPELKNDKSVLIQEAWPPGLPHAGKDGYEAESFRCSPENWFLRRPVRHYGNGRDDYKARYPPRNMLNALYCHGPHAKGISVHSDAMVCWIPTATYAEDPVPCSERFSASEGLKALATEHRDISTGVNFLDVLRSIYRKMPDRKHLSDPWFQKPASLASSPARKRYAELLTLLQKRDSVRPKSAITLLQAFRDDEGVQKEVDEEMRRQEAMVTRTQEEITVSLFEAKMMQSGPERLIGLRKDAARYETEIQEFANTPRTKKAVERELRDQNIQHARRRAKVVTSLFEKRKLKPGGLDRFRRISEEDKQRYATDLKGFHVKVHEFDDARKLLPVQGPLQWPAGEERPRQK